MLFEPHSIGDKRAEPMSELARLGAWENSVISATVAVLGAAFLGAAACWLLGTDAGQVSGLLGISLFGIHSALCATKAVVAKTIEGAMTILGWSALVLALPGTFSWYGGGTTGIVARTAGLVLGASLALVMAHLVVVHLVDPIT